MLTPAKKAMLMLLAVVLAAATGFIIHTSRQTAQARENPHTRAAQIDQATRQAHRALNR